MKALVYHGPGNKAWEDVADATIQEPTDVVVRVGTTTICGTDLHILQGDVAAVTEGRILGHEAVGTVTEVGGAVRGFKPGDRVLIPGRLPLGPVRWSHTSHAARRTGRAARGDDQGQKQALGRAVGRRVTPGHGLAGGGGCLDDGLVLLSGSAAGSDGTDHRAAA